MANNSVLLLRCVVSGTLGVCCVVSVCHALLHVGPSFPVACFLSCLAMVHIVVFSLLEWMFVATVKPYVVISLNYT